MFTIDSKRSTSLSPRRWAQSRLPHLYGAFLDLAGRLKGEERDNALALWKRRGKRAFEND